jgi:endonuclease G
MAPRRREDDNQPIDPAEVQSLVNGFLRLPTAVQLLVAVVLIVGGLIFAYVAYRQTGSPAFPGGSVASGSPQMLLGNPSRAGQDPDNYLMEKPYFALSYNNAKGTPKWVSWRLTAVDIGTAPRKPEFDPDLTLPDGFNRITHRDYSGGGFDRGHMCPHGDRSADQTMSFATFVMTNVIPQSANVNQKAWDQCESYCRDLARHGHRLYITDGPAGQGGTGRNGHRDTIANGKVVVPSDCWKIALILDDAGVDPDPSTITADARVLTIDVPNEMDGVGEAWAQYRTSPADVERRTGLHFFDRLRPDVAAALRQRVDRTPLPPPRPMQHGRGGGD